MNKPARWIFPDTPADAVELLARDLSLSLPAVRALWRRGHRDAESISKYLQPSFAELCDPALMRDMNKATNRLVEAIRGGERILLYGDYDVDGSTSVVILKIAIELAGGHADYHVPDRFGEGYGMRPAVIEKAAADGIGLIISVDTGIRASDSVKRASEVGVDVIITDHHLPDEQLPPAFAVVNPNRPDCEYPTKNLCGAGVAFKLVQSLFRAIGWPAEKARRIELSLLKMVAIATVADVVPLTGENRIIVKFGLDGLTKVNNRGLRALLDVAGFKNGERPTAGKVAFRVAPRINAAGRMASASDVVELFLTGDETKARQLAEELNTLNLARQETEAEMVRRILESCERHPVSASQNVLVFAGDEWHRGVVGIVATRLVERFHRPVFVLSVDKEKGEAQGSGRSIRPFHLLDSLESMPELFTRFGGHGQAAGLTLPIGKLDEFRRRIDGYAASILTPEDFQPVCEIDASVAFDEITDQTAAQILGMEPFGFGNPAPVFVVRGATVLAQPKVFKEKHLRVPLAQNGRLFSLKAWNFAPRLGELEPGAAIDAAFVFEDDQYAAARGRPGWGLVLRDFRSSE